MGLEPGSLILGTPAPPFALTSGEASCFVSNDVWGRHLLGALMFSQMWQQCELQFGTTHLICFLEAGKVKLGNVITLKDDIDPNRPWIVLMLGTPVTQAFIHRVWTNSDQGSNA